MIIDNLISLSLSLFLSFLLTFLSYNWTGYIQNYNCIVKTSTYPNGVKAYSGWMCQSQIYAVGI